MTVAEISKGRLRVRNAAILIGLFALMGCTHAQPGKASSIASLDIEACDLGIEGVVTECGKLNVYENRQTNEGRIIPINFIRARAKNGESTNDAVFELTGGPGSSATQSAAALIPAFPWIETRDHIFVDQRGTGGSNPLDCASYNLQEDPDAFTTMFETSMFDPVRYTSCVDRLQEIADLTQYTTSIIADDINDLRHALGYDTMTLAGGSYGTTLGLEIIRRHEPFVRAAVLRGVVPPSSLQTQTIARDAQWGFEQLFEACAADPQCAAAYPTFQQDLEALFDYARENQIVLTLPHPVSGEPTDVIVNYENFTTPIRYGLYSVQLSAALPLAVKEANAGNYDKLSQLLPSIVFGLTNGMYEGMWASVRCAEEMPYLDVPRARSDAAGTYIGTYRLDTGLEICEGWPRGARAANFAQPVVSDVPVLMVAAELDAAAPPWLAEEAAKHLANVRIVSIPNRSHWGLADPCINSFVKAFMDTAELDRVDAGCAADLKRPSFAIAE